MNTMKKKKIYFENLDGLRFLCFLSVFFFHSFHTEYDYIKENPFYHFLKKDVFGNGNIGVNFFFVLSGFLITYLLIQEKKMNGQIDLKNFWIRRFLRIWPLFYLCVAFGFFIFPMLKSAFGDVPNETANWLSYLTFTNNFDLIENGLPDASILGVLWSVAIEEQFYLVWPLILFILPINRYWLAFIAVILASWIFRGIYDNHRMHEYHTLSCIGDMAIGAGGAWLISEMKQFKKHIIKLSKPLILLIYLLFALAFFFRDDLLHTTYWIRILERSFIAGLILLIILEQCYAENSFYKMSSFRKISKLGLITYGLYCLHFIGILIATTLTRLLGLNDELWQVVLIDTSLALLISIIIALISYRFFEKPFLKFKERFAYITK